MVFNRAQLPAPGRRPPGGVNRIRLAVDLAFGRYGGN